MEILSDKHYKNYEGISRYSSFPIYFHKLDKKYIYGVTANLNTKTPYVAHEVKYEDSLDSLALKYYGRPDLYWVIADFNQILDSLIKLSDKFKVIKIPSLGSISFKRGS